MSFPWPPAATATPAQGWGVVTLEPGRNYGEVLRMAAGQTLAVGSLTFSDGSAPEPNKITILQLETALAGTPGNPGPVMTQFYQVTLASGGSFHMAFPVPLVLSGRPDQSTVFRILLVGQSPGLQFAEVGCLAVGYVF